ncbi:MAG: hypothetical protein MUE81_08690 [Thermoflexibacter sp.]|jgi:hypothetical protein|nr:hypothetical protein [Thermoflexibacter sp.]
MQSSYNWLEIKEVLKENFVDVDFTHHTTFSSVDFDKALEIFKYLLDNKMPELDKNIEVITVIKRFFVDEENKKELVRQLALNLESFLRKILILLGKTYTPPPNKNDDTPALKWCFDEFFKDYPPNFNTTITKKGDFFKTNTISGALPKKEPSYNHTDFNNFLSDNTGFGQYLHFAYHKRNAHIHTNPEILQTHISNFFTNYL